MRKSVLKECGKRVWLKESGVEEVKREEGRKEGGIYEKRKERLGCVAAERGMVRSAIHNNVDGCDQLKHEPLVVEAMTIRAPRGESVVSWPCAHKLYASEHENSWNRDARHERSPSGCCIQATFQPHKRSHLLPMPKTWHLAETATSY
jgi:hypothetical protein